MITFDRNYLVNDGNSWKDASFKKNVILRFVIRELENVYLFEIVNESEPENEQYNFSITKIVLFKPGCLDFLGNNICIITMDKKLVHYNTGKSFGI